MVSQSPTAAATENAPPLPIYYRDPRPLSSKMHAGWRIKEGDLNFAADAAYVPIVLGELAMAARNYPIVFAAGDAQPIAILGLERRNLFVEEGQWSPDAYVPAYVRRYPFAFVGTVDSDRFVLAIDAAADRLVQQGDEGAPLFEDGEPSELTKRALAFCDAFRGEATATRAFGEALQAQDLLITRRADATLPDGRKFGLEGFQIIDREKFAALPGDVVLDWHGKGYLAWIHFHLASLDRFEVLLKRQSAIAPVTSQSPADVSDPDETPHLTTASTDQAAPEQPAYAQETAS